MTTTTLNWGLTHGGLDALRIASDMLSMAWFWLRREYSVRRSIRELSAMGDRELLDMGILRGEIALRVRGR